MNKHTVLKHGSWYQPKRDEYVPITPEDLQGAAKKSKPLSYFSNF